LNVLDNFFDFDADGEEAIGLEGMVSVAVDYAALTD